MRSVATVTRANERKTRLLPKEFFARDADVVAVELLQARIHAGPVVLEITETEAYFGTNDSAAHARFGPTQRTRPLFGPPGHAYVYFCYGMHWMLNVVTGPFGSGSAVLIRACKPVLGFEVIRARRQMKEGPVLLTGPGKVAKSLGVDGGFNDHAMYRLGPLELREGTRAKSLLHGTRVGIDFADEEDRKAYLRFAVANTSWVSRRSGLVPMVAS